MTHAATVRARPEVEQTTLVEHGGRSVFADGDVLTPRYDFSTCLNAYGPPPTVRAAILDCAVDRYPDPFSRAPRLAAAAHWKRPVEEIVFGAGVAELIQLACFAYINRDDCVIVVRPAFGEYERAARLCGATVQSVALPIKGTDTELEDCTSNLVRTILEVQPRLVFVASPTSPVGFQLSLRALARIAESCVSARSLLVLDQAYDAFADAPLGTPALPGHPNVIHLRSLTKDYALAGVRVAFAIGAPEVVQSLERARAPWTVSAAAQAAATTTFTSEAKAHMRTTTQLLRAEARRIAAHCSHIGLDVIPSCTHYLLVHCENAALVKQRLLASHDILVRDCASFGLPEHFRIAARTQAENDQLIQALDCLASQPAR